jgi:hypothetical protein
MNCKKRTCCHCGNVWAGDVRVMLLQNLNDGYGGAVDMVTITAPGRDSLPHVEDADGRTVVDADAAESWNLAALKQWSKLWALSKYLLARRGFEKPLLLSYVIAYQRRGVIHYHLALAADTDERKSTNRWFVDLMKGSFAAVAMFRARSGTLERKTVSSLGLAAEWGFGFVSLEAARYGSAGVAGYFCKYVAKDGASGRPEIQETVQRVEVGRRRVVYVSSKLTARTRCTMRNLRLRRYYWHAGGSRDCIQVEEDWRRGYRVRFGRICKPWDVMPEALRRSENAAWGRIEAARAGPL